MVDFLEKADIKNIKINKINDLSKIISNFAASIFQILSNGPLQGLECWPKRIKIEVPINISL